MNDRVLKSSAHRAAASALALVLSASMLYPGVSRAQEYPTRNVVIVVPFPAGGGADLFARVIGQQLAAIHGKAFVIENRAGAGGNIGAGALARAAPDGHTILYSTSALASSSAISGKLPLNAARDLQPVTMTVSIPQLLVVHPSLPAKNATQFIQLARSKPGAIAYGADAGSAGHFAMEMFGSSTASRYYHVPYKGVAPAVTALVSGEVQSAFFVIPVVRPHLASGRLRAIGVSSRRRAAATPDIPTLQEQGIEGFEALQWHGFFVPAHTPSHIVDRLHASIAQALRNEDVKKRAEQEGAEIVGTSPKQFAGFFQEEIRRYREIATRAKMIQAE